MKSIDTDPFDSNLESKNGKEKPPISDKSMFYIHKIVLVWMIASLVIFFIGHYMNINQQTCEACYFLSTKLWFIEDWDIRTRFPEGMRLQWLFLVFSYPFICIYLLCKINDVKHGDMKTQLPVLFSFISVFIMIGILIEKDKTAQGGFTGLFNNSMIVASNISFGVFYVLMLGIVIVGLYLKAYQQYIRKKG